MLEKKTVINDSWLIKKKCWFRACVCVCEGYRGWLRQRLTWTTQRMALLVLSTSPRRRNPSRRRSSVTATASWHTVHRCSTFNTRNNRCFSLRGLCVCMALYPHMNYMFVCFHILHIYRRVGDSTGNSIKENSSIFSLIRMCYLPWSRACGQ